MVHHQKRKSSYPSICVFFAFLLLFSYLLILLPRKGTVLSSSSRRGAGLNYTLLSSYSCNNDTEAPTCFATNLCVSYEYGVFITVPDDTDVAQYSKGLKKAALINVYSVVDRFWVPDVRTHKDVNKLIANGAFVRQLDVPLLVKMPLWYHHVAHFVKDMLGPAYGTNITLNSDGKVPALLIIDVSYLENSSPAYPLNAFFGLGIMHYDWIGSFMQKYDGIRSDSAFSDSPSTDITCFNNAQLGAPHNPFTPKACQRMQAIGWKWAEVIKSRASTILLIRRLGTRVWYNLDECADVLRKQFSSHKVVVAELAQISKQAQIQLFYEADLVIAVHGNSLGNVVWMRPGSRVIEMMQFGWTAGNYFKEFSTPCGVNHTIWQCESRQCQDPTSHARNQVIPKSFGLLMIPGVLVSLVRDSLGP